MFPYALASLLLLALPQEQQAAAAPAADPKALELFEEFEEQLYDPVEGGLKSLAFDVELPGPMGGPLGVVHVSWSTDAGASSTFDLAPEMKEAMPPQVLEQMMGQMQSAMKDTAAQLLSLQTNGLLAQLLQETTPRLEGAEGGFIKIACPNRPGTVSARTDRVLYFDEEGRLARMDAVTEAMGQKQRAKTTLHWGPLSENEAGLVVTSMEGEANMPTGGSMQQAMKVTRQEIGGFHLVTEMHSQAMGKTQTLRCTGFVVNGKPVSAASAPAGG